MSTTELQNVLKPYHTAAASLLSHAADQQMITHEQYTNETFAVLLEVIDNRNSKWKRETVVISVHEDAANLAKDIERIVNIHIYKTDNIEGRCGEIVYKLKDETANEAKFRYMKQNSNRVNCKVIANSG